MFPFAISLAVIIVLFGINLLVSQNKYSMFFALCGVEIVAAALINLVRTVLNSEDSGKTPVDDKGIDKNGA